MPITWRNVGGTGDYGSAARLLEGAGKSITSGTDALVGVLEDRAANAKSNTDIRRENNTQGFKDYLAGFGSADELRAVEESGAITEKLGRYGNEIDRDVARTGVQTQIDSLRALAKTEAQEAAKPVVDQYDAMVAQGDFRGAEKFRQENRQTLIDADLLGETVQSAETAKYSQFKQKEEKAVILEAKATKAFSRQATDIIQRNAETASSSVEAEAAAIAEMKEKGIPSYIYNDMLKDNAVDRTYESLHDLSTEDNLALSEFSSMMNGVLQGHNAAIDQTLAREEDAFYGRDLLDINSLASAQPGDAVEAAVAQGWDTHASFAGKDLSVLINDSVEKLRKKYNLGKHSPKDGPVQSDDFLEALATHAVNQMGPAGTDIFDNNDLPEGTFYSQLDKFYNQMLQRETQLQRLNNLRLQADARKTAKLVETQQAITAKRELFRDKTYTASQLLERL